MTQFSLRKSEKHLHNDKARVKSFYFRSNWAFKMFAGKFHSSPLNRLRTVFPSLSMAIISFFYRPGNRNYKQWSSFHALIKSNFSHWLTFACSSRLCRGEEGEWRSMKKRFTELHRSLLTKTTALLSSVCP